MNHNTTKHLPRSLSRQTRTLPKQRSTTTQSGRNREHPNTFSLLLLALHHHRAAGTRKTISSTQRRPQRTPDLILNVGFNIPLRMSGTTPDLLIHHRRPIHIHVMHIMNIRTIMGTITPRLILLQQNTEVTSALAAHAIIMTTIILLHLLFHFHYLHRYLYRAMAMPLVTELQPGGHHTITIMAETAPMKHTMVDLMNRGTIGSILIQRPAITTILQQLPGERRMPVLAATGRIFRDR